MNTFKYLAFTLLCTTLLLSSAANGAEGEIDKTAPRTWTSRKGDKIEATFEKIQYGLVYLKKADGTEIKVRSTALCDEDQTLLKSYSGSAITQALEAKKANSQKKAAPEVVALFGERLRSASNKPIATETIDAEVIGVYFSAHWCPPCRAFTPNLVKFYDALKKEGKPFEIVFVSSDRSEDAMYEYMKEMGMNWLALPFGDQHKETLASRFNVNGIPKFVVLNSKGEVITENGRNYVTGDDTAIFDKWASGKER
jgi:nucleoredoxin